MSSSEEEEMTMSFFEAVRTNQLNQVVALLNKGVDVNMIDENNDGWSALMYAAETGRNIAQAWCRSRATMHSALH